MTTDRIQFVKGRTIGCTVTNKMNYPWPPAPDPVLPPFKDWEVTLMEKSFEALTSLLTEDHDSTTVSPMTTYLTVTLTPKQAQRVLDLLECHDDQTHQDWAIEREIDSALLAYEMDVDAPCNEPCHEHDVPPTAEDSDCTCIWLMEEWGEDELGNRPCGDTVANGELRPYCPWHASALDIDAMEFEARVEAGETWSR